MLPFKPLAQSNISDQLLALAKTQEHWVSYYNFEAMQVPSELLEQDLFFKKLPKHKAGILRLKPYTCYNWHTDTDRPAGINMLLSFGKSHCLFGDNNAVSFPFVELKYEPSTYYAFNTQVPHTVLNFEQTRYIFSIEFDSPITYAQLLQTC
jgi:hypothetical protein